MVPERYEREGGWRRDGSARPGNAADMEVNRVYIINRMHSQ